MKKLFTSRLKLCLILSFTLLSSLAFAKDEAFAVRATDVKEQPFSDAKTVAKLSENAKIEVLTRKGSWMQVSATGVNGWVKMLSLRFESRGPASSNDNSGLKSVYNLATTGSSGSTVTTATRSLDEKKFTKTNANLQALASMRTFAVSKADAQKFAKIEKLNEQTLAYVSSTGAKP
ncbi:MAG: hypothetical protein V4447_04825 [Pseudomonadota bacterium]